MKFKYSERTLIFLKRRRNHSKGVQILSNMQEQMLFTKLDIDIKTDPNQNITLRLYLAQRTFELLVKFSFHFLLFFINFINLYFKHSPIQKICVRKLFKFKIFLRLPVSLSFASVETHKSDFNEAIIISTMKYRFLFKINFVILEWTDCKMFRILNAFYKQISNGKEENKILSLLLFFFAEIRFKITNSIKNLFEYA